MAKLKSGTTIGGSTAWHSGNDGAGSGLDADLLDGQQGSAFQTTAGLSANVATLTSNSANYVLSGMPLNSDNYMNFRVMRNNNSTTANDGMFIGYLNTNSGLTRIYGGGSSADPLVKYSNYTVETNSFRAPIFYDSDNTSYYINPASGSILKRLFVDSTSLEPSEIGAGVALGTISESTTGFSAQGIGFGSGTGQHGAIVYGSNTMYFGTETGADNTLNARMTLNSSSSLDVYGDVRGTIFYDRSNTAYYVDPASTSVVNIVNAVDFNSTSDIRFKRDIYKIEDALSKVNQLNGYTFTMTETNQRAAGLIAQEVEKVLPEAVRGTEDKKMLAYDNVIGLLVEAIKEQNAKIDRLESLINKKLN